MQANHVDQLTRVTRQLDSFRLRWWGHVQRIRKDSLLKHIKRDRDPDDICVLMRSFLRSALRVIYNKIVPTVVVEQRCAYNGILGRDYNLHQLWEVVLCMKNKMATPI